MTSATVGGSVATAPGAFDPLKPLNPAGQTYHGDHAYAFYQIPVNARRLPLVMWHGAGQFSKTWETTPDGREGSQTIFLRRGFATYLIDQPRRGDAGRSLVEATVKPTPDEQMWFNQFRVGVWPNYFDGVQFARDPETPNQYFRSMTPNTGPLDVKVVSDVVAALFAKIGQGILGAEMSLDRGTNVEGKCSSCPKKLNVATMASVLTSSSAMASPTMQVISAADAPTSRTRSATGNTPTYKDGVYTATGQYGDLPSFVTVTVTLVDGIITAVDVAPHATVPASLDLQRRFAEAVPAVVVGKPIDQVKALGRVQRNTARVQRGNAADQEASHW